jgi:curved DNA-binding protein CbpA
MELEPDDGSLSVSYLKAQYKALMKRYHPDVNPRGLRACQRINEAYALLLASAADSP